jgi:hypothetical protein
MSSAPATSAGPASTTIILRRAEVINPDSTFYGPVTVDSLIAFAADPASTGSPSAAASCMDCDCPALIRP